jgi:hypothetical protein
VRIASATIHKTGRPAGLVQTPDSLAALVGRIQDIFSITAGYGWISVGSEYNCP